MNWYQSFFILGPEPANAMHGQFSPDLVVLSYVIACLASYVALDMSAHLKRENSTLFKICWWIGGAIIMGAGIWSMHFIGMIAYNMDMPMSYELKWTAISMVVAIITAAMAFLLFMQKQPKPIHYVLSGILLGIAIPTMHYTGMAGMVGVDIRYYPSIFALSILIAVVGASVALWLAVTSDKGTFRQKLRMKIISALIMGAAICGMHYTGIFAAVFTPAAMPETGGIYAEPVILSILIATIVLSILSIAIIISTTKYYVTNRIQNDRDFLEVVLNSLRGGVIAFDHDNKLKLFNRATEDIFSNLETYKATKQEWDRIIRLLKIGTKQPLTKEEYPLSLINKGQKVKGFEAITLNAHGRERILSIDGQKLYGQEGENLGSVIVYQDVTERKAIDQMKNEFISTVSHELRTPLTSIRGALGLITGGAMGEAPKEMAALLEIASNNSERLVRLINDILDTEKIESGKMVFHIAKNDLSDLIKQAVIANEPYANKFHVKFKLMDIPNSVFVLMDADRIRQVLDNLLSNAAKFSKPGDEVDVALQRKDSKVIVAISDHGSGIPQEFQNRIFSKFYQADSSDVREKGGTGLGLSICKSIIESHNGKIWFESKENVGTTFYFELLESNSETAKVEQEESIQHGTGNNQILICEDEPDVSKLLGLILKERGYNSTRVFNIAEAKQALQTQNFCLMTLDLLLPDGNGLELLKWMRTQPKLETLPVVVISAISIEQEKIKGSALGVVDWINKPIDEERLYRDVAQALGSETRSTKAKILHIEDDLDIAKVVSTLINDISDTDVSTSIATAKKMLNMIKYDLIILDLNLKDGNGYEILSYLDSNNFRIPVVILSVDEPESNVSKNIVASLIKSKVSNKDLLDRIVSVIDKNKNNEAPKS
jgi:signal transduction histidine kinase/NO-binding membrane sensor protein with MHYT domain/DNA-binding response OmpR family regulator